MSENGGIPPVPTWRLNLLRLFYLLIAGVMGSEQWGQILGDTSAWPIWKGIGKSMLAALALLALWGVAYPLKALPLLLFELAWKSVWLLSIALPVYASGRMTLAVEETFWECIPVIILLVVIPWRSVWSRYFGGQIEPWRMFGSDRFGVRLDRKAPAGAKD